MTEILFQKTKGIILFIARKVFLNRGMDELKGGEGVTLPLLQRHIRPNAPGPQVSSSRIS